MHSDDRTHLGRAAVTTAGRMVVVKDTIERFCRGV